MRSTRLKQLVALGAAVALAAQLGIVSARELAPQTSRDRGVTVRVKPIELAPGAKSWAFEVVLETHSQDLLDDLVRVTTLNGAGGAQHAPTAWEGDPPGGHHRKGVLRFAPITPAPDAVELRIQRPGESAARSFRWTLK
jgi:hypothetical protein